MELLAEEIMRPFQAINHSHKDGEGLNAFQIHRLWQQCFVDRYTYGPSGIENAERHEPPTFTRAQLQFIAGAAEMFGMVCYDAGWYCGKKDAIKRSDENIS